MANSERPDMTTDAHALTRAADRLLMRVARRAGRWIALLAVTSVVAAVAQTLLPAAIGATVDAVLPGAPGHPGAAGLTTVTGKFAECAALVLVIVVCGASVQLITGTGTASSVAWVRRLLAGHVLAAGPRLLDRFTTGDAVSRIMAGASDAGNAPASAIMAITAAVLPVGSVVALGLIDPWLAVAFCAGLPALALAIRAFSRDTSDVTVRYQKAQGAIASRLLDALAGARTIVAAGTHDLEARRVLAPLASVREEGDAFWRLQGRIAVQGSLIVPLLQVVVLAVAGIELARHRISVGELLAAGQYSVLGAGVGATIGQIGRLASARAGSRRVAEILAEPPPGYGTDRLPDGPGCLRFTNVTASPGGYQVLHGLDFAVPGGAAVAVVGRSGAGKSVLASLAGRLADPDEGEVTLDGIALSRLARTELRLAVVYAFERPALFGRTAREAISFGASCPPSARVASAARAACAREFLSRLPGGMDTKLADAPMSGGELQRLGLARAFAHAADARLLILDDATSSLDTVTEMQIGRALTGEFGGRTRLIVAHRVATAARADLVAWLDGGKLRALRPHHELWTDPAYRAVFEHDEGDA
jgi:ATP-binding cassette, subfamily B, bacterial